jgi:hypothetical protein
LYIFDSALTEVVELIVDLCPHIVGSALGVTETRSRVYRVLCSDRYEGPDGAFGKLGADTPYVIEDHHDLQGGWIKQEGRRQKEARYPQQSFFPGLQQMCTKTNPNCPSVPEVHRDFDSLDANAELPARKRVAYMYWRIRELHKRHVATQKRNPSGLKEEAWDNVGPHLISSLLYQWRPDANVVETKVCLFATMAERDIC